jgi:hypothetical protein
MAKWSFQVVTQSPAAGVADNTNEGASGFWNLVGGSATQYIKVQEIQLNGQAVATSANILVWSRDTTAAGTPTALATPNSIGPMDANTAALGAPAVGTVAATTGPFRSNSASVGKLNLSMNAFGGILRWQAAPDEEWGMYGSAATNAGGDSSLSSFTGSGTGAIGFHCVFEVK